jgi:hypothetical protein
MINNTFGCCAKSRLVNNRKGKSSNKILVRKFILY